MSFDNAAFKADVLAVLKGSPMADLVTKGIHFSHDFSGDLAEIQQLATAIVASVQIVKENLVAQHPGEDWPHIAIETADQILLDALTLPSWYGQLERFLLGPVLRGFLEGSYGTFKLLAANKDWIVLAKTVLALAA